MRAKFCGALVIAICCRAAVAWADPATGPTLVSPAPASASEPPSAPWSPPENLGMGRASSGPAAANFVSPYPATDGGTTPLEELPSPAATQPEVTRAGSGGVALPAGKYFRDDIPWNQTTQWFSPTPWDTGVEFGLNGSSDTSNTLSMHFGTNVLRESRFSKFDFKTDYNRTVSDGTVSQNNAKLNVKNDWLLDDSVPWTLFGKADAFYDQFQAYDVQTNLDTGVGYRFWHESSLNLTGRLGVGGSREFGGPNTDWTPEGLAGIDYDQKITAAHKLCCKIEYYPDLEQSVNYRIVSEASWEVALAQPSNLSLKIAATDRYDSTPDGAKPNLVNYSILMLLKL